MMPADEPVRVLYIGGAARSGSTIFGNVLGQVAGLFHGGEIWHLWDDGLVADIQCECSLPFSRCPLWSEVMARTLTAGGLDTADVLRRRDYGSRSRMLPMLWLPRGKRWLLDHIGDFADLTARVYRNLREVTGADILVDSSKAPVYAWTLSQLPGFDVRVVHLVRDVRAVTFSAARTKPRTDTIGSLPRYGPLWTGAGWWAWNLGTTAVAQRTGLRSTRVRYEDFVSHPEAEIRRTLGLFDLESAPLPFIRGNTVDLRPGHTVSGNPGRYQRGETELREDDEWRAGMKTSTRVMTTLAMWPMLRRYRYRLR